MFFIAGRNKYAIDSALVDQNIALSGWVFWAVFKSTLRYQPRVFQMAVCSMHGAFKHFQSFENSTRSSDQQAWVFTFEHFHIRGLRA